MSMPTSTIQIVPPNHRRWETILLVTALITLVLSTGTYVETYGLEERPQEILDWQVSAFSDLQGVDQAIYTELTVAADEVQWLLYYNGYWPEDADFQDAFLPPFYRDLSWERNGSVKWTLKNVVQEGEAQGLTLYHGNGGTLETQGAYLLVIDHKHAGNSQITASNIWWHPDRNAPVPETSKVPSLILHGWKQVVPYQGRDEVDRLNAG
jgi:hypothetical protein